MGAVFLSNDGCGALHIGELLNHNGTRARPINRRGFPRFMTMKINRGPYRPLWPHTQIVECRGSFVSRTRITYWLFWVWEKELPLTETA